MDIAATNIADALVSIRKFENVDGEKFEYTAEEIRVSWRNCMMLTDQS